MAPTSRGEYALSGAIPALIVTWVCGGLFVVGVRNSCTGFSRAEDCSASPRQVGANNCHVLCVRYSIEKIT